jgi:hypothetical protein
VLGEEGSDPSEIVAPKEGQEPDLSKIDLSCQDVILKIVYKECIVDLLISCAIFAS